MTHRSRTGGQSRPRARQATSRSQPKKLHHPPSLAIQRPVSPTSSDDSNPSSSLFTPTDPQILALIREALGSSLHSSDFLLTVQRIKELLYDRKWLEVFGDEALLEAYAGRWVPSRALCFRELFASLAPVRDLLDEEGDEPSGSKGVISLGGGAGSELFAFASLVRASHLDEADPTGKGKSRARLDWIGIDIGAWQPVLDRFTNRLNTSWNLSSSLISRYHRLDLLSDHPSLIDILTSSAPHLLTLLFTLTELLTQSRTSTISLLHLLTTQSPPGRLLLVADSASDLFSFEIGASGRKWPVYMLLDAVLVGKGWELVKGEDSRWYRLLEGVGVGWPVKLENTRYWMRLYRRV